MFYKDMMMFTIILNQVKIAFVILLILFLTDIGLSQTHFLLVSSRNGDDVQRFNGETGDYIDDFVSFQSGGLSAPQEILLFDGKLLITGRFNDNILAYDGITGDFLGDFSSGYALDNPTKMTLGPDSLLYVSQWGQTKSKVVRFRVDDGTFVDEFTNIDLNLGMGHAWDEDGNLYVADFGSSEIKKFDTSGVFVENFISPNPLSGPINIWFSDDYSKFYVTNWNTNSVLLYNGTTGNFESTFISQGLGNAEGVTFGPDGLIYLCDRTGNRVNKYDTDGSLLETFATGGGLNTPNSLIFIENKTTSVDEQTGSVSSYNLFQNYPNPFNPVTKIKFTVTDVNASVVKKSQNVTLKVYDVLGNEVTTLVKENLPAGEHEVTFDASNLSSGIYLYQLRSANVVITNKMTLMK